MNAAGRPCQKVAPGQILVDKYTHLYWAFAENDLKPFEVVPADPADEYIYSTFTALKKPGKLETWLALGGFDLTNKKPSAFTKMVPTHDDREACIYSLVTFMTKHGFEGVDIDWGYPVDKGRSGIRTTELILSNCWLTWERFWYSVISLASV